jgi:hypothetical protein
VPVPLPFGRSHVERLGRRLRDAEVVSDDDLTELQALLRAP